MIKYKSLLCLFRDFYRRSYFLMILKNHFFKVFWYSLNRSFSSNILIVAVKDHELLSSASFQIDARTSGLVSRVQSQFSQFLNILWIFELVIKSYTRVEYIHTLKVFTWCIDTKEATSITSQKPIVRLNVPCIYFTSAIYQVKILAYHARYVSTFTNKRGFIVS